MFKFLIGVEIICCKDLENGEKFGFVVGGGFMVMSRS